MNLCFRCLRGGHRSSKCESKTRVCNKCDRKHNILLHDDSRTKEYRESGSSKFSQEKLTSITAAQRLLEEAYKVGDNEKIKEAIEKMSKVATTNVAGGFRNNVGGSKLSQLEEDRLQENPVIMMFQNVTTSDGHKAGALWDHASDTNYISFGLARQLKLQGEPYNLVIRGVAGMTTQVETSIYVLKLKTNRRQTVKLMVYGVESVAEINREVDMTVLAKLFPGQSIQSMERPKKCDLLI